MNLTLRQLQIFESVARTLSFTKASAELHLTQPAVSMQIKLLEEATDSLLFERVSKKLFLTDAGRILLQYAIDFRRQMEDIETDLARLKGAEMGTLRLALPGTANAFVVLFVAEFCRLHRGVGINLTIANRSGLLKQLNDNETDLVIMGEPPANLPLTGERFMDNPLVVIAAPDHPLAQRTRNVPLSQLMEHEFVVREDGSGTRIAVERFCVQHGVSLRTTMEVSSNESIRQTVAAGLGLGIVSLNTLELELALNKVALIRAQHIPIMRHWYFVHRKDKHLSPLAEAFSAFVKDQANTLWPLAQATV